MMMDEFNPQTNIPARILATDLDGTLIPLEDEPEDKLALETIRAERERLGIGLVYATGRHYESVCAAVEAFSLPPADWIICDVGSSIYQRVNGEFKLYQPYRVHLLKLTADTPREQIEGCLADVANLKLQSTERQGQFKISYECESSQLNPLLEEISRRLVAGEFPYACTGSIDPFEKCGLLDVLPIGVSKAYALLWLSTHADFNPGEVVFAGDSGNDRAALVSGFRAIIVGNASPGLAKSVRTDLVSRGLEDLLYCARGTASRGVLEGCRHFGLMPESK